MSKILINLKEGSLLDLIGHQYIMSGKPQVAESTGLIQMTISRGKAEVLAQLKDGASQEAFDELLRTNNKDVKKALKAFLKEYDVNAKEAEQAKA